MNKNKYTSINLEKLKNTLQDIPEEKQPVAYSLYDELVFMQETLISLKNQVRNEGAVDNFKQGKQEFLREHPALKAYNTTVQRYSGLIKQLLELMPEDNHEQSDELLDFIGGQ